MNSKIVIDFKRAEQNPEAEFLLIANQLLNGFVIENHEGRYRLTEIEFYWNSDFFKDSSTYNRKYVDPGHLSWFFHYSGVDIALRNEDTNGYGGILVRGIYSINVKLAYKGPMVCAMKLFSGTSIFDSSIKTRLVACSDLEHLDVKSNVRTGLGKNATESGTDQLKLNFSVNIKDLILKTEFKCRFTD